MDYQKIYVECDGERYDVAEGAITVQPLRLPDTYALFTIVNGEEMAIAPMTKVSNTKGEQ